MVVELPSFAACKPGLEQCIAPAWVIEAQPVRIIWANSSALKLWHAPDLAELAARDVTSGAPEKLLARTQNVFARALAGELVRQEWVFYPAGVPCPVLLFLSGIRLEDGRGVILNQALPNAEGMPPETLRELTMFRHASVVSALVSASGEVLSHNTAVLAAFTQVQTYPEWFVDPEVGQRVLRDVAAGERVVVQAQVSTREGPRWHLIEANSLRDPVSGELGVLVEHHDETARVEAEELAESRGRDIDALRDALQLVERQRLEILSLSAPILDVGDRTLAVPIIGRLGDTRSDELTAKLLDAVTGRGVERVILDLTGVPEIDAGGAAPLQRLVRALRLLGATPLITGIRPALARQLVEAGVDLHGIDTQRSLADGLERRSS